MKRFTSIIKTLLTILAVVPFSLIAMVVGLITANPGSSGSKTAEVSHPKKIEVGSPLHNEGWSNSEAYGKSDGEIARSSKRDYALKVHSLRTVMKSGMDENSHMPKENPS